MRVNLQSRRMFLQGAGGALLAVPTLSSLLWKVDRASAQPRSAPVRYVQWVTNHGQFDGNFWPTDAYAPVEPALVEGQPLANIKVRTLSSIPGRLSPILGEAFDPLRNKLNLVRGLDLMVGRGFHNACAPTCASWPRSEDHIPQFSYSADAILEQSTKVYEMPVRVPALRLSPGVSSAYKWGSFCWTTQSGAPFKLPAYDSTQPMLRAIFGETTTPSTLGARIALTDAVTDDYRRISKQSALGAADKQLLTQYMDLLADVQQRLQIEAAACARPTQLEPSDFDILHRNAIDVAVAAMMCGVTRVVAYHCYQGSPAQYDEETFHAWAHNDPIKHGEMMVYRYKQLAQLLRAMDQVTDMDGRTLLDNSLVYAANELSDPGHGARHLQNMPILLAGDAGQRLTTGNYIDFSRRLMNNMLVTIFNMMGLTPDDYERDGIVGFGDYVGNDAALYEPYLTESERRKPLPFLTRG